MCGYTEETVSHFLAQCLASAQIIDQYFQDYYLSVDDIFENQHISTIVNFVNRNKRLIVPEELAQTGVTKRLLTRYITLSSFSFSTSNWHFLYDSSPHITPSYTIHFVYFGNICQG